MFNLVAADRERTIASSAIVDLYQRRISRCSISDRAPADIELARLADDERREITAVYDQLVLDHGLH